MRDLLQTLLEQTLVLDKYEVIVVDNNSKDNTRELVDVFAQKYSNIRYCFEPKQGLSHARNRGWQEAKGEYVGYIDDDCKAPKQWLQIAEKVIECFSPGVFGGPYYPFYNDPKPYWFKDLYGALYMGKESRILDDDEYLSGGNIFFRRELLAKTNGFNPSLGMAGRKISTGEETALQFYIRTNSPNEVIFYEPELFVYHLVPLKKMNLKYKLLLSFVAGSSYHKAVNHTSSSKIDSRIKILSKMIIFVPKWMYYLTVKTILRNRSKFPYYKNYWYEIAIKKVSIIGALYEQINSIRK